VEYYERGGKARIEIEWQRKVVQSNQPPQVNPGGPYSVDEGSFLVFDGSGSRDLDGNIVSYEWNFDYRNGVFTIDATGPIVTMPYLDGPASATVALRVTDNKGASQIATTSLTVRNVAPIVEASGPYNGLMDSPISFAGTATDAGVVDQSGLSYGWEFGDGGTATGPLVSYSYAEAGTYSVKLTVTDKDGGSGVDTATVQVTTVKQPPKAVISGPDAAKVGQLVAFDGSGSSDIDGGISSYRWEFGDGITGNGEKANHSYSAAGTYLITLGVTDDGGLTNSASQNIIIEAAETTEDGSSSKNL
jgi:PKD repeat protein